MKKYHFDPQPYLQDIQQIVSEVEQTQKWSGSKLSKILARHPRDGKAIFSRDQLVLGYKKLVEQGLLATNNQILERLQAKPTRTISGVATVTVLTKPFPCPGRCIYCPNDIRMPKSYLADEPGAQRAERNAFDPYLQAYNRLLALSNIGHSTDKVELIILGGTWSFYPDYYQIWFVKRCFDALNDFGVVDGREQVKTENIFAQTSHVSRTAGSGRLRGYNEIVTEVVRNKGEAFFSQAEKADWKEILAAQVQNETAISRCVGLVIETRPDYISEQEILKLRKLGATKIQIGVQSLNDKVQELNKRGHTTAETARAFRLLRMAGFKIHAHWMPNQLGASVKLDIKDYEKLWQPEFCPDELKIYPTSIIANTELEKIYQKGGYQPYSYEQLLTVLSETMKHTPRYCRLTRVIRDIPSTDIVAGNKLTNFRQIAEEFLKQEGQQCECIRCREIKNKLVREEDLKIEEIIYQTPVAQEVFLSFVTKDTDKICGFLRLSLPTHSKEHFIKELDGAAIIREVHVYGKVVNLGAKLRGKAQHLGLGKRLLQLAEQKAARQGFHKIAVISAIGTRKYYEKNGYRLQELYMHKVLSK